MIDRTPAARQARPEADAYLARAPGLAAWAWRTHVNRTDASGRHTPVEARGQPRQDGKPGVVPKNYTSKRPLTLWHLQRHFRGQRAEHVVGLHSTGVDQRCKWGAFDVDAHGDAPDPEATFAQALALYRDAVGRGFRPLWTDSDDRGGHHVRLILREPVPCRDLYHLTRSIAKAQGFAGDVFPKQAELRSPYGNWLRLPGRHHTREHWARVWDGEFWLEGEDAIDALLSFAGDDPALVPAAPPPPRNPRPIGRKPSAGTARQDGPVPLNVRIRRYLDRCPNKAEGQGRDDVAFSAAAFLVRDLGLSDSEALAWLEAWDMNNRPPKGRARLEYLIAGAHQYGSKAYGSGRDAR